MNSPTIPNFVPSDSEPICLISYEIARIRVGGGPDSRTGFWKAYREALEFNQKTNYQNGRMELCRPFLIPLKEKILQPHFYRKGKLVTERPVGGSV